MTDREALKLALKALENSRTTHYYCEDTWYSCPKHEDGCANEHRGDECDCGADEANQKIDTAIATIKEALAQPAQEPVAHVIVAGDLVSVTTGSAGLKSLFDLGHGAPLYATPQQRPWVGLTDDEHCDIWYKESLDWMEYGKAIEAKLKEKNT